ncbi:MAG: ABC transporter ATP-binding protein [Melioribacteraceae bacterium]|nr:ABC transporter ATP-binding protein [Melioribacteraceae bacterium]MCF8353787.1 ABC transporter ATP-binding protein [Melioribacteraceae bacterium]MCF8393623.1 ABC transporter ATP-binding protein [Melioribacteraceae bacterium]MCF8419433.1 ABC transporter ATP-binding protein [Melioribacteraceae bacterium]
MEKAFELIGLNKKFPEFELGPINLELEPGTVLGYIGPNGSGKTTTMHCMVGLVKSDNGLIKIFGRENDPNNVDWKFDIGYVGDKHVFYENWNGEKNLKFLSEFYPDWSDKFAMDLAKRFQVPLNKRARDLSSGNRVKLSLIGALAHSPKLLILDEPTSGLDPVVRTELLDVLFEVVESGERAIFYSTHILSDISRIADELAFLDNGSLKLKIAKDDLTDNWRKITFKLMKDNFNTEEIVFTAKEGNDYKVISSDYKKTIEQLKSMNAENILETRMSIDEIAVEILKRK